MRTIEQKITATYQFNGVAPTTIKVDQYDMERFPTDTVGGLFDFGMTKPARLEQVIVKLGGQSSWSLSLVDVDATEVVILSGTTEVQVVNASLKLVMLEGQKLKLVTAGATTAMVARVTVDMSA